MVFAIFDAGWRTLLVAFGVALLIAFCLWTIIESQRADLNKIIAEQNEFMRECVPKMPEKRCYELWRWR